MQTLEMALSALVAEGTIDYEAALKASLYPKEIAKPMPVPQAMGLETSVAAEAPGGPQTGPPPLPPPGQGQDWVAEPDPPRVASV